MPDDKLYFEANKNLWNLRTAVHKDSAFYDLAGFKAGANTLTPIELNDIGTVAGKTMLHLQCHFELNTYKSGLLIKYFHGSDPIIQFYL